MDSSGREGCREALFRLRGQFPKLLSSTYSASISGPQSCRRVGSFVRSLLFELQEMLESGFSASWKVNEKLQVGPVVPTELSNDLHAQQNLKFQGSFST